MKLKSSDRKCYGGPHDTVNCYRMSVKEDRGFFVVNFRHLFVHYLTRNDNMSNTTGATSREDTAYPFGGLVFVPWSLARLMLLIWFNYTY